MSFTLTAVFNGLLHYVVNEDGRRKIRLCIVAPIAQGHTAEVTTDGLTQLTLEDDGVERVDLRNKRAFFRLTREISAPVPTFNFNEQVMSGDVKGAIPIVDMIDDADRHPLIVNHKAGAATRVHAQVLIGSEEFSLPDRENSAELRLPRQDSFGLSPSVAMEAKELRSAEFVVLPLGRSVTPEKVFRIVPSGKTANLRLSHTCRSGFGIPRVPHPDEDFKFHYGLLRLRPAQQRVPIITRHPREPSIGLRKFFPGPPFDFTSFGAGGCNCVSCEGLARSFDLDAFVTP